MAEKEQEARFLRENRKIDLAHKKEHTTRWGLIIGLLAVLPIYGISIYAFNLGYHVEAAAVIAANTIAGLAGIFVVQKKGLFDDKSETN